MGDGVKHFAFQRRFEDAGDFAAVRAAEKFLTDHGFSVGRPQAHAPRGILFGDFDIQKWRNLRHSDRDALHGQMLGGREGPALILIYDDCPADGLKALGCNEAECTAGPR